MLTNVYTKAIWDRRRSIVWWVVGVIALIAWIVSVYPILRDSAAMQDFIDEFPPEMMAMFGIDPDTFLTGAGYLQAQMFSFMAPIIFIAFTVVFGSAATAREERDGTMDMLLSVPVARTTVILYKSAAMATLSGVLAGAIAATLVVANPIVGLDLSIGGILAVVSGVWLLGMVFGIVTVIIGAFTGSPGITAGIGVGLAILAWFVNSFAPLFTWLEGPSKLSPFSWYLDALPLLNGFNSGHLWLLAAVLAGLAVAVALFRRRNIATQRAVVPERRRKQSAVKRTAPRSTWLLGGVFSQTLWTRRRTVWCWALGLGAMLYLTFAAWPALSANRQALEGMLDAFPKEVLALFGLTDPGALSTPEGFISSRTYGSVGPIVLIVFAATAMTSLVAKEEASGLLDMVLANPLERRSVVAKKTVGVVGLVGIVVVTLIAIAFVGSAIYGLGFSALHIVAANVGLGLLGLGFWGIAVALWAFFDSGGSAAGATAAIAVGTFFMNGLGTIVDGLAPMRYLSPFYWYLGDTVPLAKGFTWGYVALGALAVAGSLVAVRRFARRDLAV